MKLLKLICATAVAASVSACMAPAPDDATSTVGTAPVAAAPERTFLLSWGMYGDPVFDRDVETFTRTYSSSVSAPHEMARFGANSNRISPPALPEISRTIQEFADEAVDGKDLIVVMLTSHGAPDTIAVQFEQGGPVAAMTADMVAQLLSPMQSDRQIVILQACFSGSLIDELASPNRIILTAASATRSSFGCNPDSENTWFIRALNTAITEGGSWSEIFTRTRELVSAEELAQGVTPSEPQFFVGANMQQFWRDGAS